LVNGFGRFCANGIEKGEEIILFERDKKCFSIRCSRHGTIIDYRCSDYFLSWFEKYPNLVSFSDLTPLNQSNIIHGFKIASANLEQVRICARLRFFLIGYKALLQLI
jgi:hypothetical protein